MKQYHTTADTQTKPTLSTFIVTPSVVIEYSSAQNVILILPFQSAEWRQPCSIVSLL